MGWGRFTSGRRSTRWLSTTSGAACSSTSAPACCAAMLELPYTRLAVLKTLLTSCRLGQACTLLQSCYCTIPWLMPFAVLLQTSSACACCIGLLHCRILVYTYDKYTTLQPCLGGAYALADACTRGIVALISLWVGRHSCCLGGPVNSSSQYEQQRIGSIVNPFMTV